MMSGCLFQSFLTSLFLALLLINYDLEIEKMFWLCLISKQIFFDLQNVGGIVVLLHITESSSLNFNDKDSQINENLKCLDARHYMIRPLYYLLLLLLLLLLVIQLLYHCCLHWLIDWLIDRINSTSEDQTTLWQKSIDKSYRPDPIQSAI